MKKTIFFLIMCILEQSQGIARLVGVGLFRLYAYCSRRREVGE